MCNLVSISKTAYYYQPKKADDSEISEYLLTLSKQHIRWGFDKMRDKMVLDEKPWNHKRVYRVYCDLGLNLRVKPRKRIPKGKARSIMQPLAPNLCWSVDFMSDALTTGRRFRTFNVLDDYNRECLQITAAFSLPSVRVTRLLDQLASTRGYPDTIRMDNGNEFTSSVF